MYEYDNTAFTVRTLFCCEDDGEIERKVHDELWVMPMLTMSDHVNRRGLGLELDV